MAKRVSPRCRVCLCPLQLLRDPARKRPEHRDTCARCEEAAPPAQIRARMAREYVHVHTSRRATPRALTLIPGGRDELEQEQVQALATTMAQRLKGSPA